MADLDAELLALAGGDSSGDESAISAPARKSSSPRAQKSSTSASRGSSGITTKGKKTQRRIDRSDDDDGDDDNRSFLGDQSDSASMSQSASEADFPDSEADDLEEEKPLYPYEKYYYDAADKARVDAMNQLDREQTLAQRIEQVDRHDQDNQLRRMMLNRQKELAKQDKKKRKADVADLDESQRKSSRQRTKLGGGRAGEQSSAIAAYKQQRAEKNLRDERPKDDPPAELADVQRARIGRDNFAQVWEKPDFEQTAIGCFTRVCLGPGRTPGVNEYRLCQISGFQLGRPYAMTDLAGRPFLVDQYVVCTHGKAQKAWSFLECSMSRFTEEEWRRYRLTIANEDCRMPTKGQIAAKLEALGKLIHHKWTDSELNAREHRRKALYDKVNRTDEKEQVREELAEARRAGDEQLIEELEEKLANIVPMKLALNTTLAIKDKKKEEDDEAARLAELNRRNLVRDTENIRKAQLAELHKRKAKKHLAPDDLFDGGSDISRTGTPVNGSNTLKNTPVISRAGTPTPLTLANGSSQRSAFSVGGSQSSTQLSSSQSEKKKKGIPVIRKSAMDDEILAAVDLGIDIEI
ncbi:hypothetical protein DV738_g720, partial [Chaetothyriales sp. CBS 135597]